MFTDSHFRFAALEPFEAVLEVVAPGFPPPAHGTALAQMQRVLYDVTEPVLAPLRRVIPPAGMFDISFMIVFFVLLIVSEYVCSYA